MLEPLTGPARVLASRPTLEICGADAQGEFVVPASGALTIREGGSRDLRLTARYGLNGDTLCLRAIDGAIEQLGRPGWIAAPRRWPAAASIALGWMAVDAAPQLIDALGTLASLLFLLGGVLYSVGATIYARQQPDPWPATFGFHEVFHTLVTAAAAVHFMAMAVYVFPHAGS